jgi:hypothetical protein
VAGGLWQSNTSSGKGARVTRGEQSSGFVRDEKDLACSVSHNNEGIRRRKNMGGAKPGRGQKPMGGGGQL